MNTKTVIDVSNFNGAIDWTQVTADAAIIRAGYRGYGRAGTLVTDSAFKRNAAGAAAAGIPMGVYWLSQAINYEEAEEEAQYLTKLLEGLEIAYPVYLDSEYSNNQHTGRADGLSKADRTAYALAFLEAMAAEGYTTGVYASESWFKDMLILEKLDGYTLWVAKYSTRAPAIGASYDAWQYTDNGSMAGLPGAVDMSHFYHDFAAAKKAADTDEEVLDMTKEELLSCKDTGDNPSSWAKESTEYCKRKGIFNGDGAGNYGWQQPITREAVATVIHNALEAAGVAESIPDA